MPNLNTKPATPKLQEAVTARSFRDIIEWYNNDTTIGSAVEGRRVGGYVITYMGTYINKLAHFPTYIEIPLPAYFNRPHLEHVPVELNYYK